MSKLNITTHWNYYNWKCIFKYECRWYMSGAWTIIKINNYWLVTLIDDDPERTENGDDFDYYEPDVFDDEWDDYDTVDIDSERDKRNSRYEVKMIKLDETTLQKIEKIIEDNVKTLAMMWCLEQDPLVCDWCYSRFFLWGNEIGIEAEMSNVWCCHEKIGSSDDETSTEFYGYNPIKDEYGIAENLTKLMDVFFKIKDILVENWVDEEYFEY